MNPKSYPGGEPPGASGAHDASVLLRNVSVHIGNIGKNFMAVGAPVGASDVKVKVGFVGKRGSALGAVSPGANNEQARRGVGMDVVPVAGQVRCIGKSSGAYAAGRQGRGCQIAGAGQGYPADLGGAKGNPKVTVVGGPSHYRVSASVLVYPGNYVGGAQA